LALGKNHEAGPFIDRIVTRSVTGKPRFLFRLIVPMSLFSSMK